MTIQLKRQKSLRFQNIEDPLSLFHIKKDPQNSLSEYLSRKRKIEKQTKHVSAYERQILKRQEAQNERLMHKIVQIKSRRSTLEQIVVDRRQQHLLSSNQSSKKKQRLREELTLQHENDILVERIVRMRKINSQLSKSQNKYKRSHRSVLLPKIQENSTTEVTQS